MKALGIAAGLAAIVATAALALARPQSVAPGRRIDGIACDSSEQVRFHIPPHLTIFVRGAARQIPAGVGIAPPWRCSTN
jgi:hypothetical protein